MPLAIDEYHTPKVQFFAEMRSNERVNLNLIRNRISLSLNIHRPKRFFALPWCNIADKSVLFQPNKLTFPNVLSE